MFFMYFMSYTSVPCSLRNPHPQSWYPSQLTVLPQIPNSPHLSTCSAAEPWDKVVSQTCLPTHQLFKCSEAENIHWTQAQAEAWK